MVTIVGEVTKGGVVTTGVAVNIMGEVTIEGVGTTGG